MAASASPAALDEFITKFVSQIDSGFGMISGDVHAILGTLVVISIVLTAMLWAIDEHNNVLASFVRKVLTIGFFAWLVGSWHSLSTTIVNGFGKLGLQAGGGGSVGSFMTQPTVAVDAGLKVASQLMIYIGQLASQNFGAGTLMHIDAIICAAVAALGILLAFIVLAIEVAVTVIEFHLVTLIGFVVVPFGVLSQTSFLAERAIGYVVSVGMKLMALGVILGIGINIFKSMTLSAEPTLTEECGFVLAALFLMMLALKVPSIAGALISGGPQLHSGSALMGAAGVAAGVAGVGLAGRALGGAVAGGWAAGGEKVAAARAAAGAIPSGPSAGSAAARAAAGAGAGSAGSSSTERAVSAASNVGGGSSAAAAGSSAPASGGGFSGSAMAEDAMSFAEEFRRAPVSATSSVARQLASGAFGRRPPSGGGEEPSSPPEPPSPSETVASARARRADGGGLSRVAKSAAATATAGDHSTHGMTAAPTRKDDDEEPKA